MALRAVELEMKGLGEKLSRLAARRRIKGAIVATIGPGSRARTYGNTALTTQLLDKGRGKGRRRHIREDIALRRRRHIPAAMLYFEEKHGHLVARYQVIRTVAPSSARGPAAAPSGDAFTVQLLNPVRGE